MNPMKLVVGWVWRLVCLVVFFFVVTLLTHHAFCPHIECCKRSPLFLLYLRWFDTFLGVLIGVVLLRVQ